MLQQVGRYQCLKQLGKGAMGVVYLAHDPVLNRRVAIKTLDLGIEDEARREFLRDRLLRDARAAAALSHPNVVGVHDVVMEGDCACVVMEYIEGEDLAAYLSRTPVASSQFTIHIIRAMAAALDYTHSRNIVHRDIKPANVMIESTGVPKITDFGIARITEGATATMTGTVMGTLEYMAPEQVKGETVDGRADQFALGAVAYRMLTGSSLYGDHSIATMAYKIVNEPAPLVRARNSSLPVGVDIAVAKALAKSPGGRYPNCSAFAEALTASLAGRGPDASTIAMRPLHVAAAAPARPKSGARTAVIAIALAGIAGAGVGVAILHKPKAAIDSPPAVTVASEQPVEKALPEPAPILNTAAPATKSAPQKSEAPQKAAPPETPEETDELDSEPQVLQGDLSRPALQAFNRGLELMHQQQYAQAVQSFNTVADIRPNWGMGYLNRGNAYQHLDELDAAIRDYSKAISLNAKLINAYNGRAQCYVREQKDDLALADYERVIAIKPNAPVALRGRGWIYLRRKNYQKALADFNESLRLSPNNSSAYQGRADARSALGDIAGAKTDRAQAAKLSTRKTAGRGR